MQDQWNFINAFNILGRDDRFRINIAKQGDLVLDFPRQQAIGAAEQNVRLNTDLPQFSDRMLCGLGLQLTRSLHKGDQRQMNEDGVFLTDLIAHLTNRFKKGEAFNIPHRAPDLHDDYIQVITQLLDGGLDFVGNVRNDLNRLAQIVPPPLFLNNGLIDLSGGGIVVPGQPHVHKPLIMPQIQVSLGAIVSHKHLTMLKRTHGPRIYVDIGIQFQYGDGKTPGFQKASYGSRSQALTQRTQDSTCHENKLGLHLLLRFIAFSTL